MKKQIQLVIEKDSVMLQIIDNSNDSFLTWKVCEEDLLSYSFKYDFEEIEHLSQCVQGFIKKIEQMKGAK